MAEPHEIVRDLLAGFTHVTRAAEFTDGSKRRPARLDLNIIANGRRSTVMTVEVSGKREARAIAKGHGYTPWNF